MNPTWRERSIAARARGYFDGHDMTAWMSPQTCLIGEAVEGVTGRGHHSVEWHWTYKTIQGRVGQDVILRAMHQADFDAFDRLLDEIEDVALTVKRELAS